MAYKSLFSKADLYHLADELVNLRCKYDLLMKFYQKDGKEEIAAMYRSVVLELDFLLNGYGLKEMVKID